MVPTAAFLRNDVVVCDPTIGEMRRCAVAKAIRDQRVMMDYIEAANALRQRSMAEGVGFWGVC
jgi:hypothetical protein